MNGTGRIQRVNRRSFLKAVVGVAVASVGAATGGRAPNFVPELGFFEDVRYITAPCLVNSKAVVTCSWDEVPHLPEEEYSALVKFMPEEERLPWMG